MADCRAHFSSRSTATNPARRREPGGLATLPLPAVPNRRSFLRLAAGLSLPRLSLEAFSFTAQENSSPIEEELRARLRGPIHTLRNENYLIAGNAEESFLREAITLCEELARDFLSHFRKLGVELERPQERMVVLALAGPADYSQYTGSPEEEAVGGHYDKVSRRLVTFDNRARDRSGAAVNPAALRANTIALMHEATHQLSFATGLLDAAAIVPLAVSEGLATYGETHRPSGRGKVGDTNRERLAALAAARKRQSTWLGLERLIGDDDLFFETATQQAAYAMSWLFVHEGLRNPERKPAWLGYLKKLAASGPGSSGPSANDRIDLAKAALGDLSVWDEAMRRRARFLS